MTVEPRWWGWAEDGGRYALSPRAVALLRDELGLDGARAAPPRLEDVRLPGSELAGRAATRLADAVGAEHARTDARARVAHAVGKSYADLMRIRSGEPGTAPDAVVLPGSEDEVRRLLEICAAERVAVVPFGGGTSVVGGVEPARGAFASVVALDLTRMDRIATIDRVSRLGTFEPGARGPALEEALAREGFTLGHFPQSFELATVGGWVATRSAGQASTGYGRIEELVRGLRCVAPAGDVALRPVPASAAGPSVRDLVVGSEGVLGVITETTLSLRPLPKERRYEGWMLPSFEAGAEAFRRLAQDGAAPDVARLSDAEETRLSFALASRGGAAERAMRAYLRTRRRERGCFAVLGWEGTDEHVRGGRSTSAQALRAAGAVPLGARPGRSWVRTRYAGPYLRDELLDRGALVETLETAATWSGLEPLYAAVRKALVDALSARGTPPLVLCHVSHLYESGASLYFTVLARSQRGEELAQWQAAKDAATDAIVANGGTITHHHAVGLDHARWLEAEIGPAGVEALRGAKERLDPLGIMNPGKLLL